MVLSSVELSAMSPSDPHSFARPDEAIMNHLVLNLKVDFDQKILSGTAEIRYTAGKHAKELILDTRSLDIRSITASETGKTIPYTLDPEKPFLGRALHVPVMPGDGSVRIEYSTAPDAAALQWLAPEQTAGKISPFLFSQSQAILARTWAPVQDSPGIRFTYEAHLRIPKNLMAVMSASNPQGRSLDGTYSFRMDQPIPAYLLAIAVGDFEFRSIDNRTGIYAEPVTIEKAAFEFADLPKMVDAAEKLYGPYAWERFDLIVLPPSFPFGGMENPRITFATPTIIAGDRSLTSLVAHELAHSWSGNLVTNATWNDFWLNEGFTVYFEYRIMESLYGKDFADMLRRLGQNDLKESLEELGISSDDTKLKLSLEGRDPDDGMTDIAYEKGNNLLMVIEKQVGRKRWDDFLNGYFSRHAFKTMTTEMFVKDLKDSLFAQDDSGWKNLRMEEWIYQPGLPSNFLPVQSDRFNAVEKTVIEWQKGKPAAQLKTNEWNAFEWMHFLQSLKEPLAEHQLDELDAALGFSKSGNNEILFNWMECCLRNNYVKIYPVLESFLNTVGRRKYVKPLFQELVKTPAGKKEAIRIYSTAKPNYHAITQATVEGILAE